MDEFTGLSPHIPPELIDHLNRGDCVFFVGDALDEQGPQSARLAAALVDACGIHSACPIPTCQSGGRCAQPRNCAVPLTRAAQLYESRNNRQALIDLVIRHMDNVNLPSPLHRALASLPVRVIITTAYDDRLEVALREADRPFLSVVDDVDVPFDSHSRVQCIRLYGTVSRPRSLVLTEDDAADLFGRLNPVARIILQAHLASKTLLFVGYNLGNHYFRALYRQVMVPIARFQRPAYALQWPFDALAAECWRDQISFIDVEPLSFLNQLVRVLQFEVEEPETPPLPPEPYKFLDFYTRRDAAIFFGRDLDADLLLSTILAHQLTVFYGRSGTGKTSLLLARVIPALEKAGYRVAYARILDDPVADVSAAIQDIQADKLADTEGGRRLVDVLMDTLPLADRLVVVLDQFEEFFLRQSEAVRQAFAREMADCLGAGGLDIRFVLSLRDDYLGSLDELSEFFPQDVFAHRYKLDVLTREKALLAILKPAEIFGLPIEESLRDQLITDLEGQGLEPTNLQIVLYRLYRDAVERGLWSEQFKRGTGLTLERYQALGGTKEVLSGYLDEVLAELPGIEQQQGAQAILKSIVTSDQTKVAVRGKEIARGVLLDKVGLSEDQLDDLLDYLREKRVLRKFGDEDRYELAHDVMVERVWAWFSDKELRVLKVRDMLRREMSNYQKFGHLMSREKLGLVTSFCESLTFNMEELELLLRSAAVTEYKLEYWAKRVAETGELPSEIVMEALRSADFRIRANVTAIWGQLRECFVEPIIGMLGDDYPQVRVVAIRALDRLRPEGEWRERLIYECYVPAGPFIMGDNGADSSGKKVPAHNVYLEAFYISKYPVTNIEYHRYMDDIGQPFEIPVGKEDHPVVNVDWYDACSYAAWAEMHLPTEAEWEKAACWEEGERTGSFGLDGRGCKRTYPWGSEFDPSKCNTNESGIGDTTPVGKYSSEGDSPYDCADMVGNVWEWTSSLYRSYPYQAGDGREDPDSGDDRVRRGGSFLDRSGDARAASRDGYRPGYRGNADGMRMCVG